MNGRESQNPEAPLDQLIQLLQSGAGSAVTEEQLADLSEEQKRELAEIQAALNLLDLARPGDSQAAIESADMGLDATPAIGARAPRREDTSTPQTIGHYEVLETVARGGFGVVFKARDTRLGRVVALKIPHLESLISGPDARQRFAREARLVAMLGHPAIVPVYETGSDGPILYIASAFCSSGTLGQWLRRRQRNVAPAQAAQITARLAEAVQHAHARGVIHRDLKPGNVLLHWDDEHHAGDDSTVVSALRIADFGLARFAADDQRMTQSGATIGTPAYMSPEQARGEVDNIGPASDVYALGAILYELLVGRPPIVGESNLATMRAIESETPQSPARINSQVPNDLAAICLKCLEKRPPDRYASAQSLHDDLTSFLAGRSVTARPVGGLTLVKRWCARNPVPAGLVILLLATLVTGLALTTWQWTNAQASLAESQRQNTRALAHLNRAETAIDEMLTDVAESLRNVPHTTMLRERLLRRALELQQQILDQEQDELASLRTTHAHRRIGEIQLELGQPETAIEQYRAAMAILDEIPSGQMTEAELLTEQGRLHRLVGHARYHLQRPESADSAETAIGLLSAADALQPGLPGRIELAGAYRLLGMSLQRERLGPAAIDAFQTSVQLLSDVFEQTSDRHYLAELARAHNSLAIGQKSLGQLELASTNYRAAIQHAMTALQQNPEDVGSQSLLATTALNLGNLLFAGKEYPQARESYEQSESAFRSLAEQFPGVPRYLSLASMAANGVGNSARRSDPADFELSARQFQSAIDLLLKKENQFELTAEDRSQLANLYGNLGSLTGRELNNWEDGRELQQTAVRLGQQLANDYPDRADFWKALSLSQGNLAMNMLDHGAESGEVRNLLTQAKESGLRAWRANPDDMACRKNLQWQFQKLAMTEVRMGNLETARELAHDFVELAPDNPLHHRFAIGMLAGLIDDVRQADGFDEDQKQRAANQLADWAIDLIVIAQSEGLLDPAELESASVLAPLRAWPRFQQLTNQ